MNENKITRITRQKIADEIDIANIVLGGRLNYADFLNRIFDLKSLPSYDKRDGHAYGDIYRHSNWGDYQQCSWMFFDARFNLLHCNDDVFIKFVSESIHPVVCSDNRETPTLLDIYNKNLAVDGFEIHVSETISSMPIYGVRKILSGPDIASKKEEIKVYLNSAYVKAKIKIMTDAIHGGTDLVLGTAKELIETCCKSIFKEKKIEYAKNWDLPKLFKETMSQLSFVNLVSVENPEQASKSIKQIMSGCNNIIQGVAELRNAYGSGHGKDKDFEALPIPYTKLAVASVSDILFFLLQINGENTQIIKYNEK